MCLPPGKEVFLLLVSRGMPPQHKHTRRVGLSFDLTERMASMELQLREICLLDDWPSDKMDQNKGFGVTHRQSQSQTFKDFKLMGESACTLILTQGDVGTNYRRATQLCTSPLKKSPPHLRTINEVHIPKKKLCSLTGCSGKPRIQSALQDASAAS